ncbi:MAG: mechanosensitive ion channel family protein [Firmicutes bacterium]|nr:mechanosensitive ion channel family protein [Bacillota bacterium]
MILIGAWLVLKFACLFINRLFIKRRLKTGEAEQRMQTINTLLQSVCRYLVYFVAAVMVLDQVGVRTTSLIAGAGIIGLAVGFGAQHLVRDVISGFFIVFENQYVVGDYIQAGGASGLVQELGLRMTRLRDWGGEVHIIPNGEITRVTNFTRGSMRALVDITVAYDEPIERVLSVTRQVVEGMKSELPSITEDPTVLGVNALDQNGVTLRVIAKTLPLKQWDVEREIRRRLKEAFEQESISFATQQVIVTEHPARSEESGREKDT